MAPRKRCPVCRSKQWHKEPSSGLIACSEGHILQNYRKETAELDDAGPHILKKRALKSNRQKVRKGGPDPKLYHGNRGRYFYFQCLQLILRHQVAVLTERWELPAEFEVVCRDMWALHLGLLRHPPPPEPYLGAQESDEEPPQAENPTASTARESPGFEDAESKTAPSSDGESETDEEPANDPELEELLAENSASESSSEGEDEVDAKSVPPRRTPKRHEHERLVNTLAVIVVACWTLRVPILYRDLTRLIESYELPYLEATRVLPPDMTLHLTKHNIQALSPPNTPNALVVHNLASSLAKRIYSAFGVLTPQANAAPILWRVVAQGLGGTPTLYRLTKRLSTVLELPLTLHQSLAPRLQPRTKKGRQHGSHLFDNVAPEVAFLAAAIIVLKMVYGLDGKSRLPADPEDPASDMPRIDEYLGLLRRLDDVEGKTRDTEFDSKTAMVIEDLCDDTVDEYLAFCERALVGPANAEHDVLERYFPLRASQRTGEAIATEGARPELRGTGLQDGEKEALGPGAEYTLWDSEEMPDDYAAVMSRAADWAGVGEEDLSAVVGVTSGGSGGGGERNGVRAEMAWRWTARMAWTAVGMMTYCSEKRFV
ncbi:hypothetical protein B0H17DRAFT_1336528 [Mycena rosella]|uniref:RRN7-type domain-containing protein n=1 Tax=Mycena rosella TaxID=1033263 RepID=A0AAD7CV96_MYCRO|nr:hypothetical protein B0H17DRAFT_1336528 [Mycena rosella]